VAGIIGGLNEMQKRGCDLAFFSVVASSPNLSTFITLQKYRNYFNWQNSFFCKKSRDENSLVSTLPDSSPESVCL